MRGSTIHTTNSINILQKSNEEEEDERHFPLKSYKTDMASVSGKIFSETNFCFVLIFSMIASHEKISIRIGTNPFQIFEGLGLDMGLYFS